MKEKQITIRHPELDVESIVMEESVPVWVENGWEVVGPTHPAMREAEELAGDEGQFVFDSDEDVEPSEASEKE